jgi:hypothetical protein
MPDRPQVLTEQWRAGMIPRAEDPLYVKLLNRRRDALDRRFEGIREKLKDALSHLATARRSIAQRSDDSALASTKVTDGIYGKGLR